MSGYRATFNVDEVNAGLDGLRRRLDSLRVPLERAGVYMHGSVDRNFREQGRPVRWRPLSEATIRQRRRGAGVGAPRILQDNGILRASVTSKTGRGSVYRLSDARLEFGTNLAYANTHQRGDPSRGIPARPFLLIHDEDERAIEQIFADWLGEMIGEFTT